MIDTDQSVDNATTSKRSWTDQQVRVRTTLRRGEAPAPTDASRLLNLSTLPWLGNCNQSRMGSERAVIPTSRVALPPFMSTMCDAIMRPWLTERSNGLPRRGARVCRKHLPELEPAARGGPDDE
jgi:hypothetical protein